jgi:cytochrome b
MPARKSALDMVRVWDWPLRVCHWALAVSVLVAWLTASTYDSLHRFSGYVVLGLIVFRLAWGFAGSRYSRFWTLRRRLRATPQYLWNLRRGKTGRYLGLNPAGAAMLVTMLLLLAVSAVTGWMSTTVRFFGVPWVEDTHSYVSDAVLVLALLHVLGVAVMCALQRENLVRSMVSGWKRRHVFPHKRD